MLFFEIMGTRVPQSGVAQFILYLDAKLSHSSDGDFLLKLLVTVDGQEQIGDETCKDLDHEAVLASCNEMVDLEMPFPPCEELLDVPAELVD